MCSYTYFYVILFLQFIVKVCCLQVHEDTTSYVSPTNKLQDNNFEIFSDLNSTSPILYPGVNKSDVQNDTKDFQMPQSNLPTDINNTTFSALYEKNYSSNVNRENSQFWTRNTDEAPTNILEKQFVPSPEVKIRTNAFVGQTSSDSFQPIRFPEAVLLPQLSQTHLNNLKVIPKTNLPFNVNNLEKVDLRKTPQSYGFLTNLTEETKSMLFDKSKKKYIVSSKKFAVSVDDEKIVPLVQSNIPKIQDSDYFVPETKIVHEMSTNTGDYDQLDALLGDISSSHVTFEGDNKKDQNVEVRPKIYHPYPFVDVHTPNNVENDEWSSYKLPNSEYGGELETTKPTKLSQYQYDTVQDSHGYLPTSIRPFNEEYSYPVNWGTNNPNRGKGVAAKHESWKKIIHILSAIIPIGLLLSALTPNVVVINPNATAVQVTKPIGAYNGGLGAIGIGTGAGLNFPQRQRRIFDKPTENESESAGLIEILATLKERLTSNSSKPFKSALSPEEECKEKIICELLNAGFFSKNEKLNNLAKNIPTNITDNIFLYMGQNWKTFRTAKQSNCSNYTCDPTTK